MQFTTHKEEHKKRSRRGSSFLTRPFSFPHFLPHFTSRNVRVNALLLQKRVVVCLLSLSSFSFIATTARGVKIYRERETNGETWNRRERNGRSDLEESFIFLVKRFCCKISSLQNQIIIALWKETNDDGFHVGQR
jgi:hypothetical protein